MKRVIYVFAALALVSCSTEQHDELDSTDSAAITLEAMELRAETLGYTDAVAYQDSVAQQCENGNHENCTILSDGTHSACTNAEHSGMNSDGTHRNGNAHGTCSGDGTGTGDGNGNCGSGSNGHGNGGHH
ncbi:MAG: hypothetical protein ACK5LR_01585 [Mangrovibacterium sp.]